MMLSLEIAGSPEQCLALAHGLVADGKRVSSRTRAVAMREVLVNRAKATVAEQKAARFAQSLSKVPERLKTYATYSAEDAAKQLRIAKAPAVLGKVPVVGVFATGVQVTTDIINGKPAAQSVTKGVATFAAGTLVTEGALAGAMALGLAGGPVTLAAVGLGAVAAWGAGEIVEHWGDDIANFGEDVWDSVF
ncbi:MAG: hypothetical protein ACRDPT_06685 [Streptomycetales bacterium]